MTIVTYPRPVLRASSKPVDRFGDELERLVSGMVNLMRAHHGIGLAANQVGVAKRVILVEIKPEVVRERAKRTGTDYRGLLDQTVPLTVLINPKITRLSSETEIATEGCLSLPGLEVEVKRSRALKLKALNVKGQTITVAAKGLYARVLQHEVDHLNGVLIIDHGRPKNVKPINEL